MPRLTVSRSVVLPTRAAFVARAQHWLSMPRAQAARWFMVAALTSYALLLVAGRHVTFRTDEWALVSTPPTGLDSYLRPHNEHWSTPSRLIYQLVLDRIGLGSHLPFLAVLLALHIVAVGGGFLLLRRRVPPGAAVIAAIPMLLLGSGWENLLMGIQIGSVGSVAAGIWALVSLESQGRRGGPLGAGLLVVALSFSAWGLPFVIAAAVRLLLEPRLRARAVWLAIPVATYGWWYLNFGRSAMVDEWAAPLDAITFAGRGFSYAVGRILGLDLAGRAALFGQVGGLGIVACGIVVLAWVTVRRRTPPLAAAGFLAAGAMYLIIGLARADEPSAFWNRSRHVYVAASLLIPAAADAIRALRPTAWAAPRFLAAAGLMAVLSLGANLLDLRSGRATLVEEAELVRSLFATLEEHRGAAWLDASGLPTGIYRLDTAYWIIDRYGTPVQDILVPSNALPPGPAARDLAIIRLSRSSFRVEAAARPGVEHHVGLVATAVRAVELSPDGACVDGVAQAGGTVRVSVPPGGTLEVMRSAGRAAEAALGREHPPTGEIVLTFPRDATVVTLATPDPGGGPPWLIDLRFSDGDPALQICLARP